MLVVIGLIVGGVLVGQDLIRAAGIRRTITQIESFNSAANTFFGKYGGLPGDISSNAASQFGFTPRNGNQGAGDANGVIEGLYTLAYNGCTNCAAGWFGGNAGEQAQFWVDLTNANGQNINLIPGAFSSAIPNGPPTALSTSQLSLYYPQAAIGRGNYFYVYSHWSQNFFGLSALTSADGSGYLLSNPGLTVSEAYAIDKKADDGLPQTGKIVAAYSNDIGPGVYVPWAGTGTDSRGNGHTIYFVPYTTATSGSSTTCFDNGNTAGNVQQYSVEISGGSNVTCGLMFRMQAGD